MDNITSVIQLILSAIRMTVPIAYVALGAVIIEKAGISAIAMEGMMLAGAFGAVLGSWITGNAWLGLLMGILFGMMVALVRGFFSINLRSNQTVSGLGLNLTMSGLTTLLLKVIWGVEGKSDAVTPLTEWEIPILKDIPILGDLLGKFSPLIYLFPVVAVLSWFFLNKTATGLHIKTSGEHPSVLASLGISVHRTRYIACLVAGALAGMGGAYLSISRLSFFSTEMSNGRGFMALAACIFGQWNIGGGIFGSVLFGTADAIQIRMQSIQSITQYTYFVQMLPYATTVLVLCLLNRKRSAAPAEGGKPYIEQEE